METVGVELSVLAQTWNLSTWKAEECKVKAVDNPQTFQNSTTTEVLSNWFLTIYMPILKDWQVHRELSW